MINAFLFRVSLVFARDERVCMCVCVAGCLLVRVHEHKIYGPVPPVHVSRDCVALIILCAIFNFRFSLRLHTCDVRSHSVRCIRFVRLVCHRPKSIRFLQQKWKKNTQMEYQNKIRIDDKVDARSAKFRVTGHKQKIKINKSRICLSRIAS